MNVTRRAVALFLAFAAAGAGMASAQGGCCFKTVEQAQPFFPSGSGEIKSVLDKPASGSIACGENSVSNFSRRYRLRKSEFVVRLFDYCSKPGELKADYERRYKRGKALPEFKDLAGKETYKGFVTFDPKTRTSYLVAMVDGRFKLQIQGFEAVSLADIVQVFEFLPVAEIKRFKP